VFFANGPEPDLRASFRKALARALLFCALAQVVTAAADPPLPRLTEPVHDFANAIDRESRSELDRTIRALQTATGDVVTVVTVQTYEPFADIREYAVKLFENHGRGIGEKGRDNGVLILLALEERQVWIEVGYGLEQWITDGLAGEISRRDMVPEFRAGRYGEGLVAGTKRIVGRIAQGRNVALTGIDLPGRGTGERREEVWIPLVILAAIVLIAVLGRTGRGPRPGIRRWGMGGWSGWSSGVGPFGGGWTGGRSGSFGGGFGGFGGGRSGGGGGGGRW
jgi:uncharacterized protein